MATRMSIRRNMKYSFINRTLQKLKRPTLTESDGLAFISDSREISFRLDDCPSRKAGRLLPIGVIKVYRIFECESTVFL
jgi:hypothetical protein